MNGDEKSDRGIVAIRTTAAGIGREKRANDGGRPPEEPVERRARAEGTADQHSTHRAQGRARVTQALDRVREAARQRDKERFTALLHHVNVDTLRLSYQGLRRRAAAGVDGVTWEDYGADLERRLEELHDRVHRGSYRPHPSRRSYIPKADGTRRPLAIAALEDKIVQGAVVMVLNAIYEEDFLGFSYGFRPGRGPHDALDALAVAIDTRQVNWILDADIRRFFDTVSQEWLIRFVEHRVGDRRIIRLIQKWLRAGVVEDGMVSVSDRGTGQGSVISPLLANIYLHYALDLWAERWRRREATGDMVLVRYADDVVAGFEHEADAHRFLDALRERLEEFALTLHAEKTRVIEFGRHAAANREQRGLGKPETFNFLGFTHICGRTRGGSFLLKRKSRRDRMRAKLKEVKEGLRQRRHHAVPDQGRWLREIVQGVFAYHAVPTNIEAVSAFRYHVVNLWQRALRRRSQTDGTTWQRMAMIARDFLPAPPHPPSLASPALRRQTPEVGAVCGKAARTVLCGGRLAMSVPTAIVAALLAMTI